MRVRKFSTTQEGSSTANDNSPWDPPPAAGGRLRVPLRKLEKIDSVLETWLRERMHKLNHDVDFGNIQFEDFARELVPVLDVNSVILAVKAGTLNREASFSHLKKIGFVVSSLERHAQGAGLAPGAAIISIPGLTECLTELGKVARHPPRDSHYTYWLRNTDSAPLTFTGTGGEAYFNFSVNMSNRQMTKVTDGLFPLRNGILALTDPEAAQTLDMAAEELRTLCDIYRDFRRPVAGSNTPRMTPFEFNRMRNYLLGYPVGGTVYTGPNATNIAAYPRVDIALGWVDEKFAQVVRDRMAHMNEQDVALLERDLGLPSVGQLVLSRLGLSSAIVHSLSAEALATRVSKCDANTIKSIRAYARVTFQAKALSAIHWGQISNYLIHGEKAIPAEFASRMVIKRHEGVSRSGLDRTKDLMTARINHWSAMLLPEALMLLN